ncbi:catabolite repression HPr-like protein [Niallia circulans]|uniref:Phosphocarrier protein Chr n=2 Tax=Shouchella TaxID=2893057 RepID=A0A268P1R5_SHOCL|nr:HPr family phosphocarrier protein [Shouchella clausii]SPU21044.1 catabolite repression HPr-like protein [Niallia circulans]MCM3550057.1 HPr family phosphocarrier protein [Shouchella clausii]MDO7266218.1 HPr family phosphocarrier protein [Shouchella clausii]MDO7286867.1 HPr family phosphocarrier protein [Shouchella clausii]PAE89230.1 phosphocarrier protein Chr [Shouchella clausii]
MEKTVTVGLEHGLHANAASAFVHEAGQYKADVYLKKGNSTINAKSILGLMSIVVQKGDDVLLTAEGADEEAAIERLSRFLEGK